MDYTIQKMSRSSFKCQWCTSEMADLIAVNFQYRILFSDTIQTVHLQVCQNSNKHILNCGHGLEY